MITQPSQNYCKLLMSFYTDTKQNQHSSLQGIRKMRMCFMVCLNVLQKGLK